MNRKNFVDVDAYQRETSLEEAAALCGVQLEVTGSGRNVRIDCAFGCEGDHAAKREISVDTENPAKQSICHAYQCEVRANLLKLMFGWLTGRMPSGEKLRGAEFNIVKEVIRTRTQAHSTLGKSSAPPPQTESEPQREISKEPSVKPLRNIPLLQSEQESARGLMQPPLWEKLITDVAEMAPAASAYVRRHPCLSAEAMKKWCCGVMPKGGGSDKRGV